MLDHFSKFYLNSVKNSRTLHWKHQQGSCRLHVIGFKGKKHILPTTIFQACILLLFNEKETYQFTEIVNLLNLPEDEVRNSLQGLLKGKFSLLKSDINPNSPLVTTPTTITVKRPSPNWPSKIYTCSEVQNNLELNALKSRGEVKVDRTHHTDAAIVRIMKSRRECEFQELLGEVIAQLSPYFRPDIKSIKSRIEHLVTQEYMARDSENSQKFNYIL